jgi:hypothetical protein
MVSIQDVQNKNVESNNCVEIFVFDIVALHILFVFDIFASNQISYYILYTEIFKY